MAKKFLRQDHMRHSRLGKRRKKLQKWKSPKGRHSKMRQARRGYPKSPTVGYRSPRNERGKFNGKKLALIHNIKELEKVDKNIAIIIARVGAKKRKEIIEKAKIMNIEVINMPKEGKNETK